MGLCGDDRGQAIQVGAAILLGFVVVTITLYQVEVVPSQNAEIEFDHSQAVQEDLQELRNAIANAGTRERSESVSVSLGTQFPARTIFVNPPPATGSLQTVEAGNVSVENARVDPDSEFGAEASTLLDEDHETARIEYRPNYYEYRGGPVTVVEHALAYNRFEADTLSISRQHVVRGDRLRVAIVDGDLSEQGTRTLTVDAETLSGPTDDVPIVPEDERQPIVVSLPVADATAWNETVGTTYADGEADARVADYDGQTMTVELDRDRYQLRMAKVSVGDGATPDDRYDVDDPDAGGGTGGSAPAYDVEWRDPSGQSGVEDDDCSATHCVVDGDAVDLTVATDPVADGADVTYAVGNRSILTLESQSETTDDAGEAVVTVDVADDAETGDAAYVYASSGSDGDRIELEVDRSDGGGGAGPTVTARVDDLSHADTGSVEYLTSYDVADANESFVRTDVVVENLADGSASETLTSTAPRGALRYESTYGHGDDYEIRVRAVYEDEGGDEYVAAERTVSDVADTENPGDGDDLATGASPQVTAFDVSDASNPGQGPRWDVGFDLDDTTDFSAADLHAIGVTGGDSDRTTETAPGDYRLNPDYGSDEEFAIVLLVRDDAGAVVDARRITDVADGTDP